MQVGALGGQVDTITRLKRAVHQNKVFSRLGFQERLFTLLFSGLVYPQIWEDPEVDLEALALNPTCHVVTIASGGCNVMSYLTENPAKISAVDLNGAHVALNRLKLAAATHLPSYEDFHRFFAEADADENLTQYWRSIQPNLDETSRAYWEARSVTGGRRISQFGRNFYKFGLLGSFIGLAHVAAKMCGVDFRTLLEAQSIDEQRAFFDAKIEPIFATKLVRWAASQPVSLFGLGIPPEQFRKLAGGRPMPDVLKERLQRLICDFPLEQNYFAWPAFARRYKPNTESCLPIYLQRSSFDSIRENARNVAVHNCSITELLSHQPGGSVDRFVLLDAQDWMTDAQLNALWAQIQRTARPEARVIFRTADEPSLLPGRLNSELLRPWTYHEAQSRAWTKKDRSSIYGGFHLYSLPS